MEDQKAMAYIASMFFTKNWSASTADRTTTGTENWTGHSRSYNGPVSAATTKCCCLTVSWAVPAKSAKSWTHYNRTGKREPVQLLKPLIAQHTDVNSRQMLSSQPYVAAYAFEVVPDSVVWT